MIADSHFTPPPKPDSQNVVANFYSNIMRTSQNNLIGTEKKFYFDLMGNRAILP